MRNVVFAASVITAIAAGIWQGPCEDSPEQIAALWGSGGPGCSYSGYTNVNCTIIPGCTAGTYKSAVNELNEDQNYKSKGTTITDGNCTGNATCTTSSTWDLTTQGCSGG